MTTPSPTSQPIPAEARARALLAAHLPRLQWQAIKQAESLADAARSLSASQVRGLSNALAPGPQQRLGSLRLDALARYLAWRALRSAEGGAWHGLAPQITGAIVELEQSCRHEVEELRSKQPIVWQQNTKALQSALDWLELEVIETFLHALERLATAEQADNPASGGSSS